MEYQFRGTATRGLLDALSGSSSARPTIQLYSGVPGIRTLGRLASWTKDEENKDIPEMALNFCLLKEMFLLLFASGFGKFAFVWTTVVLLGGFSTMLVKMDFWFITAIVFIETARIVGHASGREAKFFVDVPVAFIQSSNILRHVTSVSRWMAQGPLVAAGACIVLSVISLVHINTGHHYDGNVNLKSAVILFYALVLTQAAIFILWCKVAISRWCLL